MTTDLLKLLKQLQTDAGNPSYTVMKKYADLAGHDVGKSSLNNVFLRTGAKWSTVEAFITACLHIADKDGRALTAVQRDMTAWKLLYDAARDGRTTPSGQLVGLPPQKTGHFLPRLAPAGLADSRTGVLSGLGGVGKTQLAAAYARARLAAGDLVIWTDASSRDSIVSSWADAGAQLARADLTSPVQAAQRLLAWLATTSRRWLIVLDDLTEPQDLDQLRPLESAAGQIVITTRLRDTAAAGPTARVIEVGVFTEEEAQDYLRAVLPEPLADDVAGVSADLGRLPVAMGQAAAYMVDLNISCSSYRRRFADRSRRLDDLFPTADRVPGDYSRTVPVTWSLSIEAANRARPAGLALPLLELTAVLDPAGIPALVFDTAAIRNWLSHVVASATGSDWRPVGADEIRDGLRRLHLFSLASYDDGVIRVHELVQRAVRDEMLGDRLDGVCWAAADALLAAWPPGGRQPPVTQLLRASANSLARHAGERLWDSEEYHPVLALTGRSLGETGRPGAAAAHFRQLHRTAVRQLGADHPGTLAALGNLAHWQGEAGDPDSGATAQQVIDGRTRVLGEHHPDTLTARHTLARQRMHDTDYTAAETELETLLAQRTALLGPRHRDTLTTRHNLAACRGESNPAAAVTELEAVLAETVALLGPDDPDTLSTRHELARFRSLAGDPARAAAELTDLLADRTRILGVEHPDTFATRSEVVQATIRADHGADPTATFAALLTDQLRILGSEHPDTLRTRLNLADARAATDPNAEAVTELEALLDDVLRLLGPAHRLAVETSLLIGMLRDHTDLQLTVPEALLAGFLRVLGSEHPATRSQTELVEAVRATSNRG